MAPLGMLECDYKESFNRLDSDGLSVPTTIKADP
jgi:hypothetical protein